MSTFLFLLCLVTACSRTTTAITEIPILLTPQPTLSIAATITPVVAPTVVTVDPTVSTAPSAQQAVLDRAFDVIAAIKTQDMPVLSTYAHPVAGLRFSPYAYVSDSDQVFPPDQVAALPIMSRTFSWGIYSGSGAPIDTSFGQYYSEFIYDQDFANAPQIALNYRLGVSTSTDNIFEYYPSSMVVEFHFPGFDPSLQGMDWRSLRLVFQQYNGAWYLAGIVHDQWTT